MRGICNYYNFANLIIFIIIHKFTRLLPIIVRKEGNICIFLLCYNISHVRFQDLTDLIFKIALHDTEEKIHARSRTIINSQAATCVYTSQRVFSYVVLMASTGWPMGKTRMKSRHRILAPSRLSLQRSSSAARRV